MRQMLRAERRPRENMAEAVASGQQPALDRVAALAAALKAGERLGADLARHKAEREQQGQRRGL